jgi:hypothetical protein
MNYFINKARCILGQHKLTVETKINRLDDCYVLVRHEYRCTLCTFREIKARVTLSHSSLKRREGSCRHQEVK